jgi:hypothetical protein
MRNFAAVSNGTESLPWLDRPRLGRKLLSVAPPGLFFIFPAYPRLAPWAAFFRRFAAGIWWALRGAEAPLFQGGVGFGTTERRALPDRAFPIGIERAGTKSKSKSTSRAADRNVRPTLATSAFCFAGRQGYFY